MSLTCAVSLTFPAAAINLFNSAVMFFDIDSSIHLAAEPLFVVTRDILYADDILLMSSSPSNLQVLLGVVVNEGAKYGLELNWTKIFQMSICSPCFITRPDGGALERKRDVIYLGGLTSCDGRCERERSRRIGEGRATFKALTKLLGHSSLN